MSEAAAKYEAWAAQIEGQLEVYKKLRHQVRFFPLFAVVTAPLGFLWGTGLVVMIAVAWLALWATTLYITSMRTWQYKNELLQTYGEIERLRAAPPAA
jgi:hypothetical protein